MSHLLLGPMVRHVDTASAAVWVQTDAAGTVSVHLPADRPGGPERVWREPTFAVHGHHYALVEVTGLRPGERAAYRVEVDGRPVWPEPDSSFPDPELRTLAEEEPLHLAFGSCRTSVPHDRHHHLTHGVDALRSWALALATGQQAPLAGDGRPGFAGEPDLLLLLGDQVYADSTSRQMREFIASRRDVSQPPWEELKDYVEYAHIYRLAWSDPALRWLLSWLPTLMIFDDHDVRDDWNTSLQWRHEMEATSWWHDRIVAGLASYWVYQHLGNLSVAERARDEMWVELRRRQAAGGGGEVDLTEVLGAFADRVDQQPETYRWSYARSYGNSRLVVVDSRAARLLEPGARSMLDAEEMSWLDEQLQGDCEHLIVATSLPYLLPEGLHYLEAWNEAMVDGRWGPRVARAGEWLRQLIDLEHWAAFNGGFEQVARMVTEVADGRRGRSPASVLFLSGDVHHSYVTEVQRVGGARVLQLVCSPIRNPLPRALRLLTAVLAHGVARPVGTVLARSAKVPEASLTWKGVAGPWFDNNVAVLQVDPDSNELRVAWLNGSVEDGDHDHPRLGVVADVALDVPPPGSPRHPPEAHVHPSQRARTRSLRRRAAWVAAGTAVAAGAAAVATAVVSFRRAGRR